MINVILNEKQLSGSDKTIETLIPRYRSVRWEALDPASRQAYGRHMLFIDEEACREIGFSHLKKEDLFYNSYYWFLIFIKRYGSKYGNDIGVDQEEIKILETAPPNIDWKIVEEIANAVNHGEHFRCK